MSEDRNIPDENLAPGTAATPDPVEEAIEESFPASDPPGWTVGAEDTPPVEPPPDPVDEASRESFPASDAPGWTGTTATPDGEDED